ncbi:MAG: sugar phosphate isomerase/epimerase family protein [Propionibacteriaceae bacterium]
MFSLGFSTLGCPDYTVDEVIDIAVKNSFKGVEIRFLRGHVDLTQLEELSAGQIGDTRRRFDQAGIDVVCIDTSIRFTSLSADGQRAQMELAEQNCRIAAGLGARFIRVFGGTLPTGLLSKEDRRRHLAGVARGLNAVAELTANHGVTTLLETHDDFCTSAAIEELWAEGVSEKLGILWDSLHTFRFGESPRETWDLLGDRIRHVHVKDARVASPEEFDFALPGEGIAPLPEIISTLVHNGYGGYVDFEWEKAWHPEIEPPEVALPSFARYMAQLTTPTS